MSTVRIYKTGEKNLRKWPEAVEEAWGVRHGKMEEEDPHVGGWLSALCSD